MAKLPDRRLQGVAPVQTMSPQAAVATHRDKLATADVVAKLGNQVADAYLEDQIQVQNAEHRQTITDTMEYIEQNETLTQKDLRTLGILDQVEITGLDGEELEDVPRHQWASILLESEMENSRLMYGDRIANNAARKAWMESAQEADDRALRASILQTARYAQEYQHKQMTSRFELAVNNGDWDRAAEIMSGPSMQEILAGNPAMKEAMENKLVQGKEKDMLYTRAMSTDPDELDQLVVEMTDPNYIEQSSLNLQDRRSIISAAITRQNYLLTKDKQQREQASAATASYFENQMDFDPDNFDIQAVDQARDNGSLNYADYSAVMSHWRTLSKGENYKVSPKVDAAFQARAFDIEMGYIEEGSEYFETIDGLVNWVRLQREEGLVDADTMNQWGDRIRELRKQVYDNPEYKNQVDELKRVVLQVDDSSPFGFATDESSLEFNNAKQHLIKWVAANGGAAADISEWRRVHMPQFLAAVAQRHFFNLPEDVTDYVTFNENGKLDTVAIENKLKVSIREAQRALQTTTGDTAYQEKQLTRKRAALAEYDLWKKGIGRQYAE